MPSSLPVQAGLPSVDALLRHPAVTALTQPYGRQAVVAALREELSAERKHLALRGHSGAQVDDDEYARRTAARLKTATTGTLRPVFNLSGVLIHSNLGRAELPEEAIQALLTAARSPVNLEPRWNRQEALWLHRGPHPQLQSPRHDDTVCCADCRVHSRPPAASGFDE